ncbi:MAG: prepilin-type N-terminal cleavage/methylation domain-containing protein [Patescibacteria group bacterium]|jgi:type IV pilus assembly protein PilE
MNIKKGFTLLEMLVVIGIIAVLVGIVTSSYSTAQKKARDAKRQGDLKAAQQIMEQCYSVNTTSYQYPIISNTGGTLTPAACPGNASLTFSITDPLNTGTYVYTIASTTSTYTLTADLETSATNFTVSNQQ